jgi:ribosomal protein S18 acetylase RimI-like enzyme
MDIIPFQKQDLNEAFDLYKSALHQIIENVFGWDEGFQRNRFETQYELEWFNWIETESKRIGYICYFQKEIELHVSLLIMFDEFQNKGFGKIVMSKFEKYAHAQNKKVSLSSFKANEGAIKFYKSMGYIVTSEDEHFLDLSKY